MIRAHVDLTCQKWAKRPRCRSLSVSLQIALLNKRLVTEDVESILRIAQRRFLDRLVSHKQSLHLTFPHHISDDIFPIWTKLLWELCKISDKCYWEWRYVMRTIKIMLLTSAHWDDQYFSEEVINSRRRCTINTGVNNAHWSISCGQVNAKDNEIAKIMLDQFHVNVDN